MNYTDNQLKAALAKMLQDAVRIEKGYSTYRREWQYYLAHKNCNSDGQDIHVLDTELLHLCWLVEENLTDDEWDNYVDRFEIVSNRNLLHATWQQRVEALAKVKGIEI